MDTTTLAPTTPPVLAPTGRRRNVLDDAHVGDIHGALGTVPQHADRPRTRRRRLLALLAIMGPGLIVMVATTTRAAWPPTRRPARTTG